MSVLTRQVPAGVMRTIHKEWVPHLNAFVEGYLFEGNDRTPFPDTDTTYEGAFSTRTQTGTPTAPDGIGTWCKVTEDSNTVYHTGCAPYIYYTDANKNVFTSIYARPGTRSHLSIWAIQNNGSSSFQWGIVDLTTGAVTHQKAGTTIVVRPAPDGTGKLKGDSGWLPTWLVMLKYDQGPNSGGDARIIWGIAKGPLESDADYAGNGSGYIYLWRAHASRNSDYCALPIYGLGNNAIGTGNQGEGTYGVYGTGVASDVPYAAVLPTALRAVQSIEVRVSLVDRGAFFRGNTRGIFCYGAQPDGTGARFGLRGKSGGGLQVFHHNGSTEVSVDVPGTMGFLQHLELVVGFASNGSVTVTSIVNGVSAGSASTSALTPAEAWGGSYCYFGGLSPDPVTVAPALIHDFEVRLAP